MPAARDEGGAVAATRLARSRVALDSCNALLCCKSVMTNRQIDFNAGSGIDCTKYCVQLKLRRQTRPILFSRYLFDHIKYINERSIAWNRSLYSFRLATDIFTFCHSNSILNTAYLGILKTFGYCS